MWAGDKIQFSISGINSDKIEFSAPNAPLDVPPSQKVDDKDIPKTDYHLGDSGDRLFFEDNMRAASVGQRVLIVGPHKSKDSLYPDSNSRDSNSSDDTTDLDGMKQTDDQRDPRTALASPTNGWDATKVWDREITQEAARPRLPGAMTDDSLRNRFDAVSARSNPENQRLQQDGWRNPEETEKTGWTLSYLHQNAPGLDHGSEGQYWPSYSALMFEGQEPGDKQPSSTVPTVAEDVSHAAPDPLTTTTYNPRRVEAGIDPTTPAAQMYRLQEARAAQAAADNFYHPTLAGSQASQAEAPPAILPFPKMPGSVFK